MLPRVIRAAAHLLGAGCLLLPVSAQIAFEQPGRRHLPLDDAQSLRVSLADLDGDGHLDLVATCQTSAGWRQRFYRNGGGGVFDRDPRWPDVPSPSRHLLADFDGDGRVDVLLDGQVIRTLAGGVLQPLTTAATTWPIAFGDMDGDGQGDLLARHGSGRGVSLWRKVGADFVPAPAGSLPTADVVLADAALRDFDGDGDLDILLAVQPLRAPFTHWPGHDRLWRNDGAGRFTEVILPGAGDVETSAMAVGDFDGDGDQDCVLRTTVSFFQVEWQFRRNDGAGNLVVVPGRLPPTTPARALWPLDLDGDGDLDLVGTDLWLRNDGSAGFAQRPLTAPTIGTTLAGGDVDADGDLDLVLGGAFTNDGMNRLLLNDGRQTFVDATAFPWSGAAVAGVGDIDGDGDQDLLGAQAGPLFRNDGAGWFTAAPFPWLEPTVSTPVHFADVDGDGDADALFVSSPTAGSFRMRLCRNDGRGGFVDDSPGNAPTGLSVQIRATAVLDADRDGDPDFLVAIWQGGLQLFLNDGRGRFTESVGAMPALVDWFTTLAVGDLDRDGDLDVLTGESNYGSTPGTSLRFLENDGTGRFLDATSRRLQVPTSLVVALAPGDVDGDGDLDVVVGCWGTASYPTSVDHLLVNDGTGRLVAVPGRLPTTLPAGTLALGDLDQDGDLDLVAGTYQQGVRFWRNDGGGGFTDVGGMHPPPSTLAHLTPRLVDLDGDDDLDLLLGDRLYGNQHWGLEAPLLARIGRDFPLHLRAPIGTALAVPFFSSHRTQWPLPPHGTLAVVPSSTFPLPPVVMVGGRGAVVHTIPATPALIGVTVAIQAWFALGPGHLSPPVVTTIG